MSLCRYEKRASPTDVQTCWGWLTDDTVLPLERASVSALFAAKKKGDLNDLRAEAARNETAAVPLTRFSADADALFRFVAPVADAQEVWAAGVTYESSKFARMAESQEGGDFYARVYVAERPELFFKSLAHRVVGPGGGVRIRADSTWNVPEPELTALIAADGRILGYTIGNDMSSRSIEGENPLYLPQAKVYRGSCALGPSIVPAAGLDPRDLSIRLTISREGKTAFEGVTSTARMRRTVEDLAQWLFRENDFPQGVVLLTGTGIIPDDDFTLQSGDAITIAVAGIGELHNTVV